MSFYRKTFVFLLHPAVKPVKLKSNVMIETHSCENNVITLLFHVIPNIKAIFYAKMYAKVTLECYFICKKNFFNEYAAKTVKVKSNVIMLTQFIKENVITCLFYVGNILKGYNMKVKTYNIIFTRMGLYHHI